MVLSIKPFAKYIRFKIELLWIEVRQFSSMLSRFYWFLPVFTRFYSFLPVFTRFYAFAAFAKFFSLSMQLKIHTHAPKSEIISKPNACRWNFVLIISKRYTTAKSSHFITSDAIKKVIAVHFQSFSLRRPSSKHPSGFIL